MQKAPSIPPIGKEAPLVQPEAQGSPKLQSPISRARSRGAAWITRRYAALAGHFGRVLNHRTRHWTRREQKRFLVLFVLVSQAISFSVVFYQLKNPGAPQRATAINMGAPVAPPTDLLPRLTAEDTLYLRLFRARLDSLMATPAGRDTVAAFNRRRPGFIDSVLTLEQQLRP
ncbi:hypothetical protein EG028_01985 [Chitinophaga barathri]|uniref:Uncharacterized protein n=1 Tax=Chitinophaga barathri TaxID=1647451 RepID=A0A3N4MLY9_9BACT|nr:hypothetical protein EG028_01985 [Chitinophaga barathri]